MIAGRSGQYWRTRLLPEKIGRNTRVRQAGENPAAGIRVQWMQPARRRALPGALPGIRRADRRACSRHRNQSGRRATTLNLYLLRMGLVVDEPRPRHYPQEITNCRFNRWQRGLFARALGCQTRNSGWRCPSGLPPIA